MTSPRGARPDLTVLLPVSRAGHVLADDPAETELADLYDPPAATAARPYVRANMISTLDGAAHGPDGRSGSVNGPADLRVFTVLRALSDVVLVGAGTARTEGYRAPRTPVRLRGLRQARGLSPDPALAVVTRTGDLPDDLLGDDPAPWVFTASSAPHLDRVRAQVPPERLHVAGSVDLAEVLTVLGRAGLRQVLAEGGPALLADLLAAGLVDELCLTTAPTLVGGSAPRILTGDWLDPAVGATPVGLLHDDGVLLGRWALGHQ